MKIYVDYVEWFPVIDLLDYDEDNKEEWAWADLHDIPDEIVNQYRNALKEFKKEHRAMESHLKRNEAGWSYD